MALLTETSFLIQQIRLAALHNDGQLAERIIMVTTGTADASSYNDASEYVASQAEKDDPTTPKRRNSNSKKRQSRAVNARSVVLPKAPEPVPQPTAPTGPLFAKLPAKVAPAPSLLSQLIKEKSGIHNPYARFSGFSGKGELKPIKLKIWLPFSNEKKTPMAVVVKADATVEDVIGYALYEYTDRGRQPPVLDVIGAYSLRIVEDDGVIDDDFPALERSRQIEKFSFDQFALVEAPRQQVLAAEEAKRKAQSTKAVGQIFLKIHLYSTLEIKQTSTVSVSSDTLLSDLLKQLCEKHKLSPDEYTLRMPDTKTELVMTKTVGETNLGTLCLMKKNTNSAGDMYVRPAGEQKVNDETQKRYSAMIVNEFIAYKKYNVVRKMNMFGNRQERALAIDGDLIHNMPSENRSNFFESTKTTSIHVANVVSVELRGNCAFRITFKKDKETKVYDMEATTPEEAEEIVNRITRLAEKTGQSLSPL